jgi:enamine deaminase RidA (YjgF/YER057c/UK114 family)
MGNVEYLNPDSLIKNPAFTQVISVTAPAKTIYVGGQDAVDGATGSVVGKGDIKAQTEQVLKNLEIALAAAGAGLEHVVKYTIYLVQGQPLMPAFEVYQRVWGNRPNPPTVSMMYVAGLANPDYLLEIDAIAVVPESG